MGQLVGKIVLTGGPCAGKTTALSTIEQELTDRGYRVLVVGESATELIKGCIRPFGDKPFDLLDFQRLILQYQLQKEKIYEQAVDMLPEDEKCVILYDRGIMDNKAYISADEFKLITTEQGLHELDLLDSYDMVLHLVTAADGCEEYYTLENNQARSETPEQARELDKKTQDAWLGHNNLVIIDNSTDFNDKISRVLENVCQLVRSPYSIRYQRKYLVDLSNSSLDFLRKKDVIKIDMDQTYLEEPREHYERRLRKRTLGTEETFYITVQKNSGHGLHKIVTDKKITEKEYMRFLESPIAGTLKKERYTFVYKKQYFKLDIIDGCPYALLEVNPTRCDVTITLPPSLKVGREVTDEEEFDTSNLAKKKNLEYVKK